MGRLLDEDDVIDAVSRGCQEFRGIFARCEKNLNELPPAQPESCDGCKWEYAFGYGECHHCKRSFNDMYKRGEQDD